jgi:peptidoglycan/LPS O-acetylase OafA/YrhL
MVSNVNTATTKNLVIQGLRSVAVLSVLLFHAGVPWLKGGFLGVDVFFVISGYVITSLLHREITSKTFSFASFYEKRAWRLLPVLMVCLAITALIFLFLTPTPFDNNLGKSIFYASFGLSNFHFAQALDYFESGTENPVLHTWSLAVEEQFYLLFPLIMVGVYRTQLLATANRKLIFIAGITLAGMIWSILETQRDQMSAFYYPWLRGWEFTAGALIALLHSNNYKTPYANQATYLGASLLTVLLLTYSEHMIFPGLGAVLPVVSTMFLIYGSKQTNLINNILSHKTNVLVGNSSYSIYLWHWPIVCFLANFFNIKNLYIQLFTILSSLALGYLSWRLIEQRYVTFRFGIKSGWKGFTPFVLMAFSALTISASIFITNAIWNTQPTAKTYFEASLEDTDFYQPGTCFITNKLIDYDADKCLTIDQSKANYLVMGDSMAANIVTALKDHYPNKNFMQATAVEFRPGNHAAWPQHAKDLAELINERIINPHVPTKPVTLVLTARWRAEDLLPLTHFVQKMKNKQVSVIVFGPPPEYYAAMPVILAHSNLLGVTSVAQRLFKDERRILDERFHTALSPLVNYISVIELLCKGKICQTEQNGQSLYSDKLHYTLAGSRYFVKLLDESGRPGFNLAH